MTEDERIALAWVRQHLRGHHCDVCGRQWITVASTAVLVHHCVSTRQRFDWRPPRQRHDDERREWATEVFGPVADALADAVDEDEQLRRL